MKMRNCSAIAAAAATLLLAAPALAQPSEYYLGEVLLLGSKACPANMAETNGALLSINQNQALFSLMGTAFGGDGVSTFALPDLRGRAAIGQGTGPGLDGYTLGQAGGTETAALTLDTMPTHSHIGHLRAVNGSGNANDPLGGALSDFPDEYSIYTKEVPPSVPMRTGGFTVAPVGSGQRFPIVNPYLAMRYCIVTNGPFPPR